MMAEFELHTGAESTQTGRNVFVLGLVGRGRTLGGYASHLFFARDGNSDEHGFSWLLIDTGRRSKYNDVHGPRTTPTGPSHFKSVW